MTAVRRAALAWAMTAGLAFAALAAAVQGHVFDNLDHNLLRGAQSIASGVMDALMVVISLAGSIEVTGLVIIVMTLRDRETRGWRRWLPLLLFAALDLVEFAIKILVSHPSPSSRRGLRLGVGLVTQGAFPSGHMLRATLVFGLLAEGRRRAGKGIAAWAAVIAFLVVLGFSRVYLGNHWPDDVLGGVLLGVVGVGCAAATRRASPGTA